MFLKHSCDLLVTQRSNVIQYDGMGHPLRLCICVCRKCGKIKQEWIDAIEEADDVVLKWNK